MDRATRIPRIRRAQSTDEPGYAIRQCATGGTRGCSGVTPLPVSACTLTTALGAGCEATLAALQAQRSGLAPVRFLDVPLPTWTGEVDGVDAVTLPAHLAEFDCRNNRLAWLGLQQDGFLDAVAAARARWG